jgi:hypothetical protein
MELAAVIVIVVVGLAALVWGKDSRIDDVARRRNYLG